MSIETEITRIKTNISNAYTKAEEKGATLPEVQNSDNLPATIESITGGGDEWQPEPDWWDIDSIADIDDEDYPAKMVLLFNDNFDTLDIYKNGSAKIVTSDGTEYTGNDNYFTHTWDKSKDKECSLGYKTRYVIFYYNSTGEILVTGLSSMHKGILYMIIKNFTIKTWSNPMNGDRTIQALKVINSGFSASDLVNSCSNFQRIININSSKKPFYLQNSYTFKTDLTEFDFSLITNLNYAYQNMFSVRKIGKIDTSKVTTFAGAFRYNYNLEIIESIDFNSATNVTEIFKQCYNLHTIGIKNIKISGLNFEDCPLSHESLLNILNALYDYSADTENTYTITLGATNLAKLTEEEIAIGTNKGWTIS